MSSWLKALGTVAAIVLALVVGFAYWVGSAPSVGEPAGDAVVVHAGQLDRVDHAVGLMDQGAAPTLVIMYGGDNPEHRDSCGSVAPYEIICPAPEPITTIGEAIELGILARERGWQTVVSVTSDYHLRRAAYLDAKCSDLNILPAGSGNGVAAPSIARYTIHETIGMVQARFIAC